MKNEPWDKFQAAAEHVRRSYQTDGDSAPPARRDVQLILDASFVCRMATDFARSSDESSVTTEALEAMDVIDELLMSFQHVLSGVGVHIRDLARQCRAAADGACSVDELPVMLDMLATELHQLVGPGSADSG